MDSEHYHNPYTGQTFFGFFLVLCQRLWLFLSQQLSFADIASDEIQMLVLIGISASAGLVGSFLVLRKMTMLANSLSHTILIGIVLAYLAAYHGLLKDSYEHGSPLNMQSLLIAAVVMGVLTTFLTEFLTKTGKLQEDASIGIVFTSLFALGVILLTVATRNAHIGTEVVMGNVDALQKNDCKMAWVIFLMNALLFFLFFKEYKITTFDPGLAQAFGISITFFNYLLMVQVSITSVGAFRAVGVLMVLAFITGPVLTARLLTYDLKTLLISSVALGAASSMIGVALARHFLSVYDMALSTGGIVVCTITVIYIAAILFSPKQGLFVR